jgi:hypothetical protein
MKKVLIASAAILFSGAALAVPLNGSFNGAGTANFGSVGPTSSSLDGNLEAKTSTKIDNLQTQTTGGATFGSAVQVQQGGSVTGVGAPATKTAAANAAAAAGPVQAGNGSSSIGGPSVLPSTTSAESAGVAPGAGSISNSFDGKSTGGAASEVAIGSDGATSAKNIVQYNPTVSATTDAAFAGSGNATTVQTGGAAGLGAANGNGAAISTEGLQTQSLDASLKTLNTTGATTLPVITNGTGTFNFN